MNSWRFQESESDGGCSWVWSGKNWTKRPSSVPSDRYASLTGEDLNSPSWRRRSLTQEQVTHKQTQNKTMNPIDMTFEEKVEQVTKPNRIPSGQGSNFSSTLVSNHNAQECSCKCSSIPRIDPEYVATFTIVSTKVDTFHLRTTIVKPQVKNERVKKFGLICEKNTDWWIQRCFRLRCSVELVGLTLKKMKWSPVKREWWRWVYQVPTDFDWRYHHSVSDGW